jgi:hypothetical protein
MVVVAALLVWVLIAAIGFGVYKGRGSAMIAGVPAGVWRWGAAAGVAAAGVMAFSLEASSRHPDWVGASAAVGVVAIAVVALLIVARRRRQRT